MTKETPRRVCYACDGEGGFDWWDGLPDESYEWVDCRECNGVGTVVDLDALGEPPCPVCEGVGFTYPGRACPACDGAGYAGGASPHAKG